MRRWESPELIVYSEDIEGNHIGGNNLCLCRKTAEAVIGKVAGERVKLLLEDEPTSPIAVPVTLRIRNQDDRDWPHLPQNSFVWKRGHKGYPSSIVTDWRWLFKVLPHNETLRLWARWIEVE